MQFWWIGLWLLNNWCGLKLLQQWLLRIWGSWSWPHGALWQVYGFVFGTWQSLFSLFHYVVRDSWQTKTGILVFRKGKKKKKRRRKKSWSCFLIVHFSCMQFKRLSVHVWHWLLASCFYIRYCDGCGLMLLFPLALKETPYMPTVTFWSIDFN